MGLQDTFDTATDCQYLGYQEDELALYYLHDLYLLLLRSVVFGDARTQYYVLRENNEPGGTKWIVLFFVNNLTWMGIS